MSTHYENFRCNGSTQKGKIIILMTESTLTENNRGQFDQTRFDQAMAVVY